MTWTILEFLASATVIAIAGTALAHYADRISDLTGLGRLLIGSVLLAGATSLPELAVDISAVRSGMIDLAIGDLLGSSLMNLLILAVLDATSYTRGRMLSREAAGHALSGTMSISLTALVGFGFTLGAAAADWNLLGISLPMLLVLGAYCLGVRLVYIDQRLATRAAKEAEAQQAVSQEPAESQEPAQVESTEGRGLGATLALFAVAATVIVFAGPILARSAGEIAAATGLGETFVGTVLVAFTTSLPEVVASAAALRMGAHDLAIGNIFGSNTFNMILFVPLDAIHPGSLVSDASTSHLISCLAVIVATTVVIQGLLYRAERRLHIVEPDAWLVIIIVFGALWFSYRFG